MITRACATCASKNTASSSVRTSAVTPPPRASIASDALAYSSATVFGMPSPLRISKIDATIESISGLAVTRCCFVGASGSVLVGMRSTKVISCLTSPIFPSRCSSACSCCASVSGASFSMRKPEKRASSTPAGREVQSITWPCGDSTSTICCSISARLAPASSSPSRRSSARRAIIAWRSMRYTRGLSAYVRLRYASIQFQCDANASGASCSFAWSSCTLITMGTSSAQSSARTTTWLMSVVLPAAGGAVSSAAPGAVIASPRLRAACSECSQSLRPRTSCTPTRSASPITSMATHCCSASSRLPVSASKICVCCLRSSRVHHSCIAS